MQDNDLIKKLTDETKSFSDLAYVLADETAAADDLLQAHAAWVKCHTENDCEGFLKLPQMASRLEDFRRDEYFHAHQDKVLAQVPDYLDSHPELVTQQLNKHYTPTFMIKTAQHINENPGIAIGATVLLGIVLMAKLTIGNPLRWCGFFKKKSGDTQDQQSQLTVITKRSY